jgi:hypothetical protein
MNTNIKNLPNGEYFTRFGFTDKNAYRVVKRTAKSATISRVEVDADLEWKKKMKITAGGFGGHCHNQHEQTWLFRHVDTSQVVVRQHKDGWWRCKHGERYVEGIAREFYDYNF